MNIYVQLDGIGDILSCLSPLEREIVICHRRFISSTEYRLVKRVDRRTGGLCSVVLRTVLMLMFTVYVLGCRVAFLSLRILDAPS